MTKKPLETNILITYHTGCNATLTSEHKKIMMSFEDIIEVLENAKRKNALCEFHDFAINPQYIITVRKTS